MAVWKRGGMRKTRHTKKNNVPHKTLDAMKETELSGQLEDLIRVMSDLLGENSDFIIRKLTILGKYPAAIFYISNLVDEKVVNQDVLKPIMFPPEPIRKKEVKLDQLVDVLQLEVLYHAEVQAEAKLDRLVEEILNGKTVLAVDGLHEAFHIETRHVEKRSITQPETEQVIMGPRESFIEDLGTNIGLIRYRLPTADFRVKTLHVGRMSKSKVAICYLKGTTHQDLVDEVEKRLSKIDVDDILDVGYLEQFIEDHHLTPFPQTYVSERPDATVGNLIEGRVAVLVDGSPFAMLVPVVFSQFYQTTEDYSSRLLPGTFVRLVRLLALAFSLVFPSLYVSFISFNPEMMPTEFAVAVAGGRATVPFPAVVEVLFMEVAMEVLREATVRLPQQVGGALSIVGVLIVGQAAVEAGLASPITVVIIAITTIGSFATPAYTASFALRILRFPIIILAGIFGLYGVVIGVIVILNHMLSLKSFGVPYLSPFAPGNVQGLKDVLIRSPLWWMPKRPDFLHSPNDERLGYNDDLLHSPPHNTLDRKKVGNKRWEGSEDGVSPRDHSRTDNNDSH